MLLKKGVLPQTMTRYRRRVKGRFFIFLITVLLIIVAISFGAKTAIDYRAVAKNADGFDSLIQRDQFDLAFEFYQQVEQGLSGKVRDQSLEKMNTILAQRVENFSRLAKQGPIQGDDSIVSGLKLFAKPIGPMIENEVKLSFESYRDGKMEYDRILTYFDNIRLLGTADDAVAAFAQQAVDVYNANEGLRTAQNNVSSGNYYEAYKFYVSVPQDSSQYEKATAQAQRYQADAIRNVLNIAGKEAEAKNYEAAEKILTEALTLLPDNEEISAKLKDYQQQAEVAKNDLVLYTGPVEHVFTHCLIAFPEIANQSPSMQQALYRDCVTPHEFTKMLEQLYANNYILIDINMLYEETTDENGNTVAKLADLMLPKGKKTTGSFH